MGQTGQKAEMAVVVCTDRNLFWQAAFFLARSLASDREGRLDHYLYCSDPLDDRFRDILGDRVTVVEKQAPEVDGQVGISRHLTTTSLLRITALQELCATYRQVAYSDVDIFLRWGSFAELIPLAGHDRPLARGPRPLALGRETRTLGRPELFPLPARRRCRAIFQCRYPDRQRPPSI